MRVLMLGWEFPPYISGGLGTACHGLACAMSRLQMQVLFVLPRTDIAAEHSSSIHTSSPGVGASRQEASIENISLLPIHSRVSNPYQTAVQAPQQGPMRTLGASQQSSAAILPLPESKNLRLIGTGAEGGYDGDLISKIQEYTHRCIEVLKGETFDLIHAHDWVTFPAAVKLAATSGKPLIVQIHATEFDRSGERVHEGVYEIERYGMHEATRVIAVSQLTKRTIVNRYGIPPEKVTVVHNGIDYRDTTETSARPSHAEKTVLFLGRITMQKGPQFFVATAARIVEKLDNVRFVIAGWGDLGPQTIEQVASMGLGGKVFFTGFLHGSDVDRAYRMSDVYVMPSISEPFGLTALEAVRCGVPAVVSKNSGVAEVLPNGAMKVDFWDIDEWANKIVGLLKHPEMAETMRRSGYDEIRTLTWDKAAKKCITVYQEGLELVSG